MALSFLLVAAASGDPATAAPVVLPASAGRLQLALPAAASPITKQANVNLNLRAKASAGSKVLLTIPRGTKLKVLGTSGKWIKVTYKSKTGWASGDFMKTVPAPRACLLMS
ncbi:hypothetical protein GCM10023166_19200 [Paeniglutamicibacter cryotolerans]|uniref:Uncharacterized protein YgiM (DUF1202 family) n=2 Tax=Paeniglutamicibacter cryotolerans TaxID=670079 RepID=A0A839QQG9_9MICC|nr:uncharacterized protein YgiM (DUF1202 family) [Paeniglutamicibacter cryotolerans]